MSNPTTVIIVRAVLQQVAIKKKKVKKFLCTNNYIKVHIQKHSIELSEKLEKKTFSHGTHKNTHKGET